MKHPACLRVFLNLRRTVSAGTISLTMKTQFHLARVEKGHLVDMRMTFKFELNHVGNITQTFFFFYTKVL